MRIVLSNHSLFKLGGSETWLKTMYDELSKNHEVHVYTPIHQLWPWMTKFDPRGHYDLGLVSHTNCLEYLREQNIDKIIHTSHGVIPAPEEPIEGADVYVSVSEEVQASNLDRFGFESIVIRNPIDTLTFAPWKPTNPTLEKVLFLSNYGWGVLETMQSHDFDYMRIGGEERIEETWKWINWADLVVGLGRSAYEAMSCGRNVIIFDYMGADGLVTPENIYDYRRSNCSGRTNRKMYTPDEFKAELAKYDPNLGPQLREYVHKNNNVVTIAEQYLSL